jgi:hypothetical protein
VYAGWTAEDKTAGTLSTNDTIKTAVHAGRLPAILVEAAFRSETWWYLLAMYGRYGKIPYQYCSTSRKTHNERRECNISGKNTIMAQNIWFY